MYVSYKYRIYPNKAQTEALERCLSIGWRIWNDALNMRKVAYEDMGVSISKYDLSAYWCGLRPRAPVR